MLCSFNIYNTCSVISKCFGVILKRQTYKKYKSKVVAFNKVKYGLTIKPKRNIQQTNKDMKKKIKKNSKQNNFSA